MRGESSGPQRGSSFSEGNTASAEEEVKDFEMERSPWIIGMDLDSYRGPCQGKREQGESEKGV